MDHDLWTAGEQALSKETSIRQRLWRGRRRTTAPEQDLLPVPRPERRIVLGGIRRQPGLATGVSIQQPDIRGTGRAIETRNSNLAAIRRQGRAAVPARRAERLQPPAAVVEPDELLVADPAVRKNTAGARRRKRPAPAR